MINVSLAVAVCDITVPLSVAVCDNRFTGCDCL